MKSDLKKQHDTFFWNIILFFSIAAVALASLFFTRKVLIEDARNLGKETVASYSGEEEQSLETYKTLIDFGAAYIEGFSMEEKDAAYIADWLRDYYKIITDRVGEDTLDLYAVMGDTYISIGQQEGKEYDVYTTVWYQKALEADGDVIYTNSYFSELYQRPVITIAEKCGNTGNVIAFVVFPENFRVHSNSRNLPEGSSYFMCDSEGAILYAETDLELKGDASNKSYFQDLFESEKPGNVQGRDIYYYDNLGRKVAVFHKEVPNGWHSILMIPESFVSEKWKTMLVLYLTIFIGFAVVIVIIRTKENRVYKNAKRVNETVHMLGNTYYALYRVNVDTATYEMIKGSEDVKGQLPQQGSYYALLEKFKSLIAEEMCGEFVQSFSLENMKKQIEENVKEFGGDFHRLFHGEYKWVNVRMLFSQNFSKNEVVLCFRKVEEEKRRQLEGMALTEQALKMAQASEKSQKQFFANMSHDMRTPLNIIIGMSELAGKNLEDEEKVADYLKKINASSRQLLGLINDILEMSRLEQGITLEREEFNLRREMEESLTVFRIQAREAQKKFDFTCELTHEQVWGDLRRLNQVINNLVSNAVKFTKKGERISVRLSEMNHCGKSKYRLIVKDTGRGMTEEFLEHLFIPYEREKRFDSREVEGTGLGMPIVKMIVTLMGGEIHVESIVNQGTTFTVTFPLEIAEVQNQKEEEQITSAAENADEPLEGRKILLAEDYELNMEVATDILKMNGASVIQARNGKEALELFAESEEFAIDAILMDMQMPVMDGCEAAKRIRRLERRDAESIPIIAVTANAFAEDISRTMNAGMNAHITKPIDVTILCSTLDKWVQKGRKLS